MAYYDGAEAVEQQASYLNAGLTKATQSMMAPTKRKRLEERKFQLEKALEAVNSALNALNSHPELEQFLNVLETADRY